MPLPYARSPGVLNSQLWRFKGGKWNGSSSCSTGSSPLESSSSSSGSPPWCRVCASRGGGSCFAVGESSPFNSLGSTSSVGFVPLLERSSFTPLQVVSSFSVVVNAPSCSSFYFVLTTFSFFSSKFCFCVLIWNICFHLSNWFFLRCFPSMRLGEILRISKEVLCISSRGI